ncbi:GNAT family N-acetyltransferase [candidate division CSSED10-310 bacterium]|uniref:GNAT family N-acetyltransferase n=1 Tax=candidate division CSSED10-310 bacterium TaxID=2855610 RepID=A0ABV6YRW7_UNCC1
MIIETPRLVIRRARAQESDIDLFYTLWTDPQVMKNVGFPSGLKITRQEIREIIMKQDQSEFNKPLIIQMHNAGPLIGECKLGLPDNDGISETDVKLRPRFWGKRYGTEVKQSLVDYLFTHTRCIGIKATPNKLNRASQKMQEAVGARKVGEEQFTFPEHMRHYTNPVSSYIYIVYREDWELARAKLPGVTGGT